MAFNIKFVNLSLFDTQIMNCLPRHKNLSSFWKSSELNCDNINYKLKITLYVLLWFAIDAHFINTNASYFNIHRLEADVKFSRNCALGLSTSLGLRPRVVLKTSGSFSQSGSTKAGEYHVYIPNIFPISHPISMLICGKLVQVLKFCIARVKLCLP